jgi:glycerophosphoryl diester phosphodiesterase
MENSLAAFRAAVELGADGVELDVHTTADGVPVVHHDDVAGKSLISETRYTELRDHKLGNGEPMPTLARALSTLDTEVEVYVEVKTLPERDEQALLDVLKGGAAPHNYHVHSFDHRIVRRLKTRCPSLHTGILSVSYPVDPVAPLEAAGALTLWQQERMVDRALVRQLHRRVFAINAWTVDDPHRVEELLEMSVNGICTNCPDVARDVLG